MNEHSQKPARGIYLLPNLLTTGGMFAGFYAIIAAINAQFEQAAVAVFVAGVLDGLDGRIARLTNTQSDFGVQYDSLADLISFGLAPALVMYTWALHTLKDHGSLAGKIGWSVAFFYAACAAVRLARFNTQVSVADKRYFIGLASPAAAGVMMSFVWTMVNAEIDGHKVALWSLAITFFSGALMVSRVRYWSFKSLPQSEKMPFLWVPALLGIFVLLAVYPSGLLLGLSAAFALSGPIMSGMAWHKRKRKSEVSSNESQE
jgi:CDP-diacylglycerol--serine O-phosphatidyltransferase